MKIFTQYIEDHIVCKAKIYGISMNSAKFHQILRKVNQNTWDSSKVTYSGAEIEGWSPVNRLGRDWEEAFLFKRWKWPLTLFRLKRGIMLDLFLGLAESVNRYAKKIHFHWWVFVRASLVVTSGV
ncbi:hypothetical protein [Paenibacillus sp. Z6-24]